MKSQLKKCLIPLLLTAACLCLTGCLFNSPVEKLYSLPQLPSEYTALEAHIDTILSAGAEYAAPLSGTNIQPVQLLDLDGDGVEEAVGFFRKNSDEKTLKIHVFRAHDDTYEEAFVIEGSGSAIYSISYSDMNQDGCKELIVGWKISTEMQALSVYSLVGDKPEELLRTTYAKYAVSDLNQDQAREIVVIRADGDGNSAADYYGWQDKMLTLLSTAKISTTVAELSQTSARVKIGWLQNQVPALFVTGVEDGSIEITDILAVRDKTLTNVTQSATTGVSTAIFRFLSLYPMDINGDGLTEVPVPATLPTLDDESICYQIFWRNYDLQGRARTALATYHDVDDGWYITLPESWENKIMITRSESGTDEAAVTFSTREKRGSRDFLRIYTITGDSREYKAVRGTRFVLSRQPDTIYAAELLEGNESWSERITEDTLRDSFHLILTEWAAGDN